MVTPEFQSTKINFLQIQISIMGPCLSLIFIDQAIIQRALKKLETRKKQKTKQSFEKAIG